MFATAFVAAVCGAMMWEYRSVTLHGGGPCGGDALYPVSAVAGAVVVTAVWSPLGGLIWLGWGIVAATAADLLSRRYRAAWWGLAGIVYLGLAGIAFLFLRIGSHNGLATAVWLFLVVAASDIGGYFAGRMIGGPKLWPRVSPKKTWAGTAGGAVLAMAAGGSFAAATEGGPVWAVCLISAVTALVSQAGDLAESALKRHFGVKDSGRLLPGHGGAMDRFDGLVAAALLTGIVTWWRGGTAVIW